MWAPLTWGGWMLVNREHNYLDGLWFLIRFQERKEGGEGEE